MKLKIVLTGAAVPRHGRISFAQNQWDLLVTWRPQLSQRAQLSSLPSDVDKASAGKLKNHGVTLTARCSRRARNQPCRQAGRRKFVGQLPE
jgi:hypothetical protein